MIKIQKEDFIYHLAGVNRAESDKEVYSSNIEINSSLLKHLEKINFKGYSLQSLWVNYMKAGDYNPRHVHTGDLSFVIFLDVPKKLKAENLKFEGKSSGPGTITFTYGESNRPFWATCSRSIFPQTGEMYIFPALLNHYVHPFKTKNITRISVSGNVNIEFDNETDRSRYDII